MSFINSVKSFFVTTEADVVKVFIAIENEVVVAEKAIQNALKWIAGNSAVIEADLTKVQQIVTDLGLAGNPTVSASLAAASVAAEEFIKFAKAYESGQSTAATVAVGYQAYTQTKAAVATALAAAAKK